MIRATLFALATLCAYSGSHAQAPVPPSTAPATGPSREAMSRAVAAFRSRNFSEALQAAEAALAAGGGPEALEAIAVASLALGNTPRAFETYSTIARDETAPANIRGRAKRQAESLERQTGRLALENLPADGRVFLDDALVGVGPAAAGPRVFPGKHRLRVEFGAGRPFEATVTATAGATTAVTVVVTPAPSAAPASAAPASPSAAPATNRPLAAPVVPAAATVVPAAGPASVAPDAGAPATPGTPDTPPEAAGAAPPDLGEIDELQEAGPSEFERLVLFGNLDATKRTGSSASTVVQVEVGPSYVRRSDEGVWGTYLEAVLTTRLEMNDQDADPAPRPVNLALSGPIDIFGNTEAPSSPRTQTEDSGTGTTSSPTDALEGFVGSFAKFGLKRYFSETSDYFGFAELQVRWDTALGDENGRGGEEASYEPDARLLVGPGFGRLVNLSSRIRVRSLEADLSTMGLLASPLTPELRRKLRDIFEAEANPTRAHRAALELLANVGALSRTPTFDDTIRVVERAGGALRFQLKGLEYKFGALVPALQSKQTEASNDGKTPVISALQVIYTRPYSDQIQLTGQGGLSYQATPASTVILSALLRIDRKFSSVFQTSAYTTATYVSVDGSSGGNSLIQLQAVGQANFFVTDSAAWQTTAQLTNTRQEADGSEDKETELRLIGNFAYTY
jgi:hypothetical protein